MRTLTLPLALLVLLPVSGLAQRNATPPGASALVGRSLEARVTRVADGDTLDVIPAGQSRPIRVRLEGVDAPEQGEVFSREAVIFLRALLFDQRVLIAGRDVDRYDRLVARVLVGTEDASVRLVRAGLACHAYAYDAALAREEAQARAAGAGFWGAPKKPACVTRTAFSAQTRSREPQASSRGEFVAAPFRGNVSSLVYHAPHCRNYTCRNCTRLFASEGEAKAAGFRPAGDCLN